MEQIQNRLAKQRARLNNKGSAMVTVLVVTTFITVLATTMLYIAGQNYQQKQTDYQNKRSFYGAEDVLEDFKALLVKDASDAYKYAYNDTAKNFVKLGETNSRMNNYNDKYVDKLIKIWDERCDKLDKDESGAVKIDADAKGNTKIVMAVRTFIRDSLKDTMGLEEANNLAKCIYSVDSYGKATSAEDGATNQFVIKGVKAKYTYEGYTTFIYTDIGILVPGYGESFMANSSTTDKDDSSTSVSSSTSTRGGKDIVALTDYVVYMNWKKTDYDF